VEKVKERAKAKAVDVDVDVDVQVYLACSKTVRGISFLQVFLVFHKIMRMICHCVM